MNTMSFGRRGTKRVRGAAVGAVCLAVLAVTAACGGSDSSDASSDGPQVITLGVSGKYDYTLPASMAPVWDEFSKRGITIELQTVAPNDALVLLSTGKLDAFFGAFSAGTLNAVEGGARMAMVAPGETRTAEALGGWYVSTKALDGRSVDDPAVWKGAKVASQTGTGSFLFTGLAPILEPMGLGVADVKTTMVTQNDVAAALINGSVLASSVGVSMAPKMIADKQIVKVGPSYPLDFPSMNLQFGKRLLDEDRELGQKVVDGFLDMYANRLQGDQYSNPESGQAIAKQIDVPFESLKDQVPGVYSTDFAFPDDFIETAERIWRELPETITYKGTVADKIIDPAFMEQARKNVLK